MADSLSITFDAYYGDEKKVVEISEVFGAGAGTYHLLIDCFFQGSLVKRNGEWRLNSNTNLLTSTDIQILGEVIDERLAVSN